MEYKRALKKKKKKQLRMKISANVVKAFKQEQPLSAEVFFIGLEPTSS